MKCFQSEDIVPARTAITNDLGEYRIYDIPPGNYYLAATDSGQEDVLNPSMERSVAWLKYRQSNHPTLYYPGVTGINQADQLALRAGQEVHIDLALHAGGIFKVSGKVLGPGGAEVTSEMVFLEPQGPIPDTKVSPPHQVGTDQNGNFVISEVFPGLYEVSSSFSEDGHENWAKQQIEVTDTDVTGIQLQLKSNVTLSGQVIAAGRALPGLQDLKIRLDGRYQSCFPGGNWPATPINKDGTFAVHSVRHDRYRLHLEDLPKGWYLRAASFGNQNILENGLDLSEADPSQQLQVRLSPGTGHIQGIVLQGAHPAPFAMVRLFPEYPNPNRPDLYHTEVTDANGHFEIGNIAPGSYRLATVPGPIEIEAIQNKTPADASSSIGFVIAPRQSKVIKLRLPERENN